MRYLKTVFGMAMALGAGNTAAAAELDWLAGRWCGGEGDEQVEEVWLPTSAGMLLGMSRTTVANKAKSFEFMRIVDEGGKAALHVQPDGAPATVFIEVERDTQRVRFGNAAHDFPNQIEYQREGEQLRAWIAGPGRDGQPLRIDFEYRVCPL